MFKEVDMRTAVNAALDGEIVYMCTRKGDYANKTFRNLEDMSLRSIMYEDDARFIVDEENTEGAAERYTDSSNNRF